jgi:hypothetical protein
LADPQYFTGAGDVTGLGCGDEPLELLLAEIHYTSKLIKIIYAYFTGVSPHSSSRLC